jgi:hypothetical protein
MIQLGNLATWHIDTLIGEVALRCWGLVVSPPIEIAARCPHVTRIKRPHGCLVIKSPRPRGASLPSREALRGAEDDSNNLETTSEMHRGVESLAPPTYRRTLRNDGGRGRSEVGAGRWRSDRPRSRDARRYGATMHQAGARSFVTRPRHDWKHFGPKLSKSASDRVTTLPGYLGLLVTGAVGITGNRYASYIDCRTSLLAVGFGANSPVPARCPGRPGALAAR